jgi:Asp-tRNA(Asn)/Glu-tRNA(Gln) amidotransferase B subunit
MRNGQCVYACVCRSVHVCVCVCVCVAEGQGSLRCDVNVSVRRPGAPPGIRCELKNLNSLRALTLAIGT